jgi:hypothetical protein
MKKQGEMDTISFKSISLVNQKAFLPMMYLHIFIPIIQLFKAWK